MTNTKPSPIEVWLTQENIAVTGRLVQEDESTNEIRIDSLSMRGAQREITGFLIGEGYEPVGRWDVEQYDDDRGPVETSRKFKLKVPAKADIKPE